MRSLIACGLCCAALGLPAVAQARPAADPDTLPRRAAAADTVGRRQLDLPAGPLAESLRELARQAELEVTMDSAAVAGVRAPAVAGLLTVREALQRLLAGRALQATFASDRAVVVAVGPQALTRVTVRGERAKRAAYGALRTVSATRTSTPLRDTPQAVTVVTSELMADQSMQSMADVVRYVPGITMGQGEGHRDAPTIRGNSSTSDFFVDGVRDDAQYLRDVYNVERVEALKGANAMTFGRGGGGGVINRVVKDAQWAPTRTLTLSGGSWEHRRAALDVGQALADRVAGRVNGVFEDSRTFRDAGIRRFGVNPTLAFAPSAGTAVRASYELFDDQRTVDRGIPSYRGRPSPAPVATFFGDPGFSQSEARVHNAGVTVEQGIGAGVRLRNQSRWTRYDKYYTNLFPGAVTADGSQVSLSAYASGTDRTNLFNQTDVTATLRTGGVRHELLAGAEIGRQVTGNTRLTGYFGTGTDTTSILVPFGDPTVNRAVRLAPSASDADNRVVANVAAAYVQDQLTITPWLQAVAGLRVDRFAVELTNQRADATAANRRFDRTDSFVSPRAGLVLKPAEAVSVYGSYGVSFLPASGDQFSSLNASTSTLKPEEFRNGEVGMKWELRPDLAITAAAYQVDRLNTTAPHPTVAGRLVQTGAQRTTGVELGVAGNVTDAWQVAGGWATQQARITSRTSAAPAGRTVPLVPHATLSLWNRVQLLPRLAAGVGVVHQTKMYAAIDNAVVLPAFTRADAALFVDVTSRVRAQANVENVLDAEYYPTSHGNNNIMPGAPRTVRISLVSRF